MQTTVDNLDLQSVDSLHLPEYFWNGKWSLVCPRSPQTLSDSEASFGTSLFYLVHVSRSSEKQSAIQGHHLTTLSDCQVCFKVSPGSFCLLGMFLSFFAYCKQAGWRH